jgi:hypothetical protein
MRDEFFGRVPNYNIYELNSYRNSFDVDFFSVSKGFYFNTSTDIWSTRIQTFTLPIMNKIK